MKPEAPKVWNCALYVRVSTDRQASKEFSSLDTQEDVLRQFVKEKNEREEPSGTKWTIVKVYSEAKSAKDTNRPVFQQMLRDIEAGLVNMIVFIRLDRFSRSLRDFLNLQDFLRDHGCGFISKHDPMLDTSSPHGEFIVRLFLMLAEYERKLTSARVKEKMGWRATQGLWNGGQILGYDLSRNPTGTLVVNEKEAAIIRYLYRTYAETRSLRQTAKLANEKGHRTKSYLSRTNQQHEGVRFNKYTVWQTLINPVYAGLIRQKGQVYPGKHPAIVPKAEWDEVRRILREEAPRRRKRPSKSHDYLLQNLVYCGLCGAALVPQYATTHGRLYHYYKCRSKYNGNQDCRLPVVQAGQLEDLVTSEIRRMANDPALMTAAIDYARAQSDGEYETLQNELHVKQAEVARMEKEERNLVQFVRSTGGEAKGGVTPVSIAEELRTLRDQLTAVREQVAGLTVRLKEARRKVVDPEAVRDCLRFFDTVYEMLSPAEKGTLIASFVQKVVYTTELLQIFLYNEPFDRETMAQAEKALRDAPVAAGGATGLSSSNEWWALQDLNL